MPEEVQLKGKCIGIALLLSEPFNDQIIAFQRAALAHVKLTPLLDRASNLPHITLVQGNFKGNASETTMVRHMEETSRKLPGATASLGDIIYKDGGWIFLLVSPDPWIRAMHDEALRVCAPELIPPDATASASKTEKYSDLERASYLKYGYRYTGDAYLPHITLGRMDGDRPEGVVERLNDMFASSGISRVQPIAKISAYAMGPNGSHAETLAGATFGGGL